MDHHCLVHNEDLERAYALQDEAALLFVVVFLADTPDHDVGIHPLVVRLEPEEAVHGHGRTVLAVGVDDKVGRREDRDLLVPMVIVQRLNLLALARASGAGQDDVLTGHSEYLTLILYKPCR